MSQISALRPHALRRLAAAKTTLADSPWLAAVAIVPILATVYQTLVLTDVVDDVVRLGIQGDRYAMIWTNVAWGASVIYGVFAGMWCMGRFGARESLVIGLVWFAVGNLLCGAAADVPTLAGAKLVEGIGKGMVIMLCRATLYRQFGAMVVWAMGFYGVIAYATRPTTPLLTAIVNDLASWRWIFWLNVPIALLGIPLVLKFLKPDRPEKPSAAKFPLVGVTLFVAWVVSLTFVFGWYRKWGGWTSNAFSAVALFAIAAPLALVILISVGGGVMEHLRRMFRVRTYVLAMSTRMLMLVQLLVVLSLLAGYCLELREYLRDTTGWLLAPATLTMALSTILTFVYRPRALRHMWLLVAVVGCAGSLWWMSSLDAFTSKQQIAWMVALWGGFVGLFPPVFLQDEVEELDPHDKLIGGALAILSIIVPIVVIPTLTSTVVAEWADRSADAQLLNLRQNRPELETATAQIDDYYQQHGVEPIEAKSLSGAVLGGAVKAEAVTHGIQSGLRFMSIIVGLLGLIITAAIVLPGNSKPG